MACHLGTINSIGKITRRYPTDHWQISCWAPPAASKSEFGCVKVSTPRGVDGPLFSLTLSGVFPVRKQRSPYVQSWNLDIQRQATTNTLVDARGTGACPSLVHLPGEADTQDCADSHNTGEKHAEGQMTSSRNLPCPVQDVADNEIEPCPNYIHGGRRQTLSRWMRKRCWKAVAGDTMHEMWHDIGQERS